jgi:hypothetical protein
MSPAPPRRPPEDAKPPVDKVKRDDEKAPEQFKNKEFEKVKADKEQPEKLKPEKEQFEKVKAEKEQPEKLKPEKEQPEKLKPEKEFKAEGKEFEKAGKELEKVKSDKEFEKVKNDKEQPEKLKPEKEHKGEVKEFKELEKIKSDKEFEKLKSDKELVREKQFLEKTDKEVAEGGPIDEVINPAAALDPAALLAHADSLEQAGRQLRHFIERSMRPDLSTGALQNEADLTDEPAPEQDDG